MSDSTHVEKLREEVKKLCGNCDRLDKEELSKIILSSMAFGFSEGLTTPFVDRPQGEWLKFGLGRGTRILFCTNCERRIEVPLSQGDLNYDFCPNCGARMKGADDEIYCK